MDYIAGVVLGPPAAPSSLQMVSRSLNFRCLLVERDELIDLGRCFREVYYKIETREESGSKWFKPAKVGGNQQEIGSKPQNLGLKPTKKWVETMSHDWILV